MNLFLSDTYYHFVTLYTTVKSFFLRPKETKYNRLEKLTECKSDCDHRSLLQNIFEFRLLTRVR